MSEQQVCAKCAWRLIPFMGLLLLLNSIDRTNVGFAALTMNKDLGFSPTVFGLGAGVFFIGCALFQVPANVLLQRIGARRWVFCISAMWSVLSTLNAFVQSPMSFYAVRFFLGVAEAGFFSGMLLYLTYWFPRTLLAHYTAYFTLAVPLSFVVGGPLASLFLGFDGVAGIHGWQWLFLIEGVPAFFNLVHVKAGLSLTPKNNLRLSAGLGSEWRATLADAIYTMPDTPVPNTAGRGSRYVGAYSQLRADYALNSHIAMALEFVHFLAGPTIVSAGGRSTDYLGTEIRYGW